MMLTSDAVTPPLTTDASDAFEAGKAKERRKCTAR